MDHGRPRRRSWPRSGGPRPADRHRGVAGETTLRQVLRGINGDALDAAVSGWLADRLPTPGPWQRRALAVDSETLRGAARSAGRPVHLLAAIDHATGAVLAQRQVDGAHEEVTGFRPLLADLDPAGGVVTADALHAKRDAAEFLVTNKHAQLRALPWRQIPVLDQTRDRGHGRVETRALKVATVPGLGFPHATQAFQLTRRLRDLHRRHWRTVTVDAITSLSAIQASPARLAELVRGHWATENGLHHDPDRDRAPQVIAACASSRSACSAGLGWRRPAPPRPRPCPGPRASAKSDGR